MKLTVLAHASAPAPGLATFTASCRRFGLEPHLVGWGEPWRGFGARLKRIHAALAHVTGPVLHADAFDVALLFGPEVILERWHALNTPLLVGAEAICFPDDRLARRFPARGVFRYLNGGGLLGDAVYLRDLLTRWEVERLADDADDQGWWHEHYLAELDSLKLDTDCEVFQCLAGGTDWVERRSEGVFNRLTETYPAVLHGNGRTSIYPYFRKP